MAQSLGGFTAPLVCERVPVELLVLVASMIPAPGEARAGYWSATRYAEEVRERYDDDIALFYQDVPRELAAEALKRARGQSEARLGEPSPLRAWPDVPTRALICRDDRLFPPGFLRRVARERLGIPPDEIDGGHTPALSRPRELADRLEAYAAGQGLIPATSYYRDWWIADMDWHSECSRLEAEADLLHGGSVKDAAGASAAILRAVGYQRSPMVAIPADPPGLDISKRLDGGRCDVTSVTFQVPFCCDLRMHVG